jgi:hypothetical protein
MNISYILPQHIGNIDIIIIIIKNKTHVTHLDLKICLLMYIYNNRMFTYKKYRPFGPCHINGTKIGSPAYQKGTYNQGASKAPPAAPPSGGGGGPPRPAPGGGGGTSAGPPCPGGRRPLVIAASTAARRMIDRHGGGNPMHCSRNSSS